MGEDRIMKPKRIAGCFLLFVFLLLIGIPCRASAASYTWKSVGDGDMRCYKNGTQLVKSRWVEDRHLNADGYMDRNTWLRKNVDGEIIRVFVRDDGKWVPDFKAGWQEINKEYYYYTGSGKIVTGWIKIGNKMYYANRSTRARVKGIFKINGKQYYFSAGGVLQRDREVTYNGKKYTVDSDGVCTLATDGEDPESNLLFFLTFESGSAAYDQTGGDHGNACGAYQFDNRYSLLPFVKYAYARKPTLCKEFKSYAGYTNGTKLKSNANFYKAWHKIYARGPKLFSKLQDKFAKQQYYDPVERVLSNAGIDLADRPNIVKGAVFSYSIQHGQTTAANAVKACGIKKSTTDAQFLKKLYDYRIKRFPAYRNRYAAEYALAKSRL